MNLWPSNLRPVTLLPYQVVFRQAELLPVCDLWASANSDPTTKTTVLEVGNEQEKAAILTVTLSDQYPCKVFFDGMVRRARTEGELIGLIAASLNSQKTIQLLRNMSANHQQKVGSHE